MSIDTDHQNPTQLPATAATSDPKGKGKEKEVDPSAHEDMSDSGESAGDTWAEFPFERFPSPPGDKSSDARVPNATPSLDPPLMDFTYPPPPHLANDPTWYAQMVADVHRNRAHVNTELKLARIEAAEALADVTLAEIELKAEMDRMQNFLNRVASVAGKNFVRKMIRKVQRSMKTGVHNLDDECGEELQDADYEDSSASDEGEVHHQDAEEENFSGGAGETEEGAQDAKDEECSRSDNDGSCKKSESPHASCSPSSPDCPQQCLRESFNDGETIHLESSEPPPADKSLDFSPQEISRQPCSPDWRRGDVTDDEYSSGEDDTNRKWTDLSPMYKSRKRPLEVEEEETNSPEDSPRKKFKETSQSPLKDIKLCPVPMRCFYPPEEKQDNAIDQDHDSEEEYEVEKSLTLEDEPELPRPYLPQLNRLERDPYRVRQNSQGEPELYVPGRLAIDLP